MKALFTLEPELRSQQIIYSLPIKDVLRVSSTSRQFYLLTEEAAQLGGFTGCKEIGETAAIFSRILPVLQMHGFCRDGATWGEVSLKEAARFIWWIRRRAEEPLEDPLYKVIRAMVHIFARETNQPIPSAFVKDPWEAKIASIDNLLQEKDPTTQSELFRLLPKEIKCDPDRALVHLVSLIHSPVVSMVIRYCCALTDNPQNKDDWEEAISRVEFSFGGELRELFDSYQIKTRLQAIRDMFADKDISNFFKTDSECMQASCILNGWLLSFASEDIKSLEKVALTALRQNPYAVRFVEQKLLENISAARACIQSLPCKAVSLAGQWILQEPVVNPLRFVGEIPKNDFYTVLLAVRRYGPQALLQANPRFFNNRYMLKACLTAGFCEEEGVVLFVRSDLLKTDKILMRQFAKVYPYSLSRCYPFLPLSMQKDPELLRQLPWYQRWFVARR